MRAYGTSWSGTNLVIFHASTIPGTLEHQRILSRIKDVHTIGLLVKSRHKCMVLNYALEFGLIQIKSTGGDFIRWSDTSETYQQ